MNPRGKDCAPIYCIRSVPQWKRCNNCGLCCEIQGVEPGIARRRAPSGVRNRVVLAVAWAKPHFTPHPSLLTSRQTCSTCAGTRLTQKLRADRRGGGAETLSGAFALERPISQVDRNSGVCLSCALARCGACQARERGVRRRRGGCAGVVEVCPSPTPAPWRGVWPLLLLP